MVAYVPFITPLNLHDWWWLMLIPMSLFLSIAYKGVRLSDLSASTFIRAVVVMTAQIVLAMIALAIGLYVLIERIVPWFQS